MNEGMMWWDDSPRTSFVQKVEAAVEYYQRKYHCTPDTCVVRNSPIQFERVGAVNIRQSRLVLVNAFWIGVDDDGNADHCD
jgi:hypothetical protein